MKHRIQGAVPSGVSIVPNIPRIARSCLQLENTTGLQCMCFAGRGLVRGAGRVSLIAGMEYGMERWNGKWNGTVNVCSHS